MPRLCLRRLPRIDTVQQLHLRVQRHDRLHLLLKAPPHTNRRATRCKPGLVRRAQDPRLPVHLHTFRPSTAPVRVRVQESKRSTAAAAGSSKSKPNTTHSKWSVLVPRESAYGTFDTFCRVKAKFKKKNDKKKI